MRGERNFSHSSFFMDKYTIFEQAESGIAVATMGGGEFMADAAQRDLDAALQLLAERAQYLTGARGASIALFEDGAMICHASAGRAVPEVGAEIETGSGLIAETIRTRRVVSCADVESDLRANRESCEELGVKSVIVMPLLRDEEVAGVFELVADRVSAFEERDMAALARLADMALTAVEHAEAARRALPDFSEEQRDECPPEMESAAVEGATVGPGDEGFPASTTEPSASVSAELARIGSCQSCGFPVSQVRALCVDCEQAGKFAGPVPSLVLGQDESWFQAHSYTIGTLVIAALTLALLALKLR
jgi:putative methionine-R-sulfoxide reductase with GAF domain